MLTLIAYAAEPAAAEVGGIGALGLDLTALLFQVLNFSVLLGALWYFAYKPILGVLRERHRTIAESLQSAKEIATTRQRIEAERTSALREAQASAVAVIERSKKQAVEIVQAAELKAAQRVEQIHQEQQARLQSEVQGLKKELRREAALLVTAATERILDEKLDQKRDQNLIERALEAASAHLLK